jgi:tetratricopeptide (TPR) repeat protein
MWLLAPGLAHADDAASAREHFKKGSSFFDVGRFGEAAQEYEQAYQLKNDPALLFNLGQAYRFNGDYAKAIVAYKSFLRHVPNAPNAAEVQQHIADLQKLLDEQKRATSSPPTGTLAPGQLKSTPSETPPEGATATPAAGRTAPGEASSPTLVAAPSRKEPIYKKWWLWTAVGSVVVVGVAVGVGVGLGTRVSGTNLQAVTF